MNISDLVNPEFQDPAKLAEAYQTAAPFPSIVMPDFFKPGILDEAEGNFPNLANLNDVIQFDDDRQVKFACNEPSEFPKPVFDMISLLNSKIFIDYLQVLTGIERPLIADPYLWGGGLHEIKRGGMLKVHADFNKHPVMKLDRRLNLLVYLNRDWDESYGGHFEMWDEDMTKAVTKVSPRFNTVAIFSTTSFTYHGHPDPLTCPADRSRRSIALYYYSNGRPEDEVSEDTHGTLFKARTEEDFGQSSYGLKDMIKDVMPPIMVKAAKKFLRQD